MKQKTITLSQCKNSYVRQFFLSLLFALLPVLAQAQGLYVGVNWHPHDLTDAEIDRDIKLMKEAGITTVRVGHLAWDSYEPQDGQYNFEWFDRVMDKLEKAHIKAMLDIAVRPAPLWLHKKFPTISIGDADGGRIYPNNRYYQDVGDPNFQKYALRYTDVLTKRYAKHPALLGFGIDNEMSCGKISYSEEVRQRFIAWVKAKYHNNTEALNKAWAGQRWSRRISDFEEIGLPQSGAPERTLDFRRFVSDELNGFYLKMLSLVRENAPKAQTYSNAWYYSPQKYFDYTPIAYSGLMTREGCGFYPGSSLLSNSKIKRSLLGIERTQFEATTPFWCSEFTTMTATPNAIRKYAYLSLMYGNQMVCGWTWQAMHAGEEQFLEGLLNWDGTTNAKYDEYKKIATEFRKLDKFFPYQLKSDVGLAWSFPSQMLKGYKAFLTEKHDDQLTRCFNALFDCNLDSRVLDIKRSTLKYKLLIVPGMAVMDDASAKKIRQFVKDGGTVIMTANSAIVDSTGQVFRSQLPGMLSDVFGVHVGGYGETEAQNEVSRMGQKGENLILKYKGKDIKVSSSQYDYLTADKAEVLANIISLDKDYPVITTNKYGKGQAIYIGVPAAENIIGILVDELVEKKVIAAAPKVPAGIAARQVDDKHLLLFNITDKPISIPIAGNAKSILTDKKYAGSLVLAGNEPEFIEILK